MVRIACGAIVGTVLLLVLPIASPLVAIHVEAVQVEVLILIQLFKERKQ